ncbi:RNase H domain-containing protein [Trichonephila clavipes]|nr:RNase H domain-containing protein [Trichonephila clavipes]
MVNNRYIEAQVAKCRKRLKILSYMSRRDRTADANTLRKTYISLVRPILEYGFPIHFRASEANVNKLERVELSAARITAGLCNNCHNNIVLYDSDLPTFSIRKSYILFDSDRIHFLIELLTKVCKGSDIPEFTRQIAIETMHGLPHSAFKIYTDSSMGDGGMSGSGVQVETPDGDLISRLGILSTVRFLDLNLQQYIRDCNLMTLLLTFFSGTFGC